MQVEVLLSGTFRDFGVLGVVGVTILVVEVVAVETVDVDDEGAGFDEARGPARADVSREERPEQE